MRPFFEAKIHNILSHTIYMTRHLNVYQLRIYQIMTTVQYFVSHAVTMSYESIIDHYSYNLS